MGVRESQERSQVGSKSGKTNGHECNRKGGWEQPTYPTWHPSGIPITDAEGKIIEYVGGKGGGEAEPGAGGTAGKKRGEEEEGGREVG